MTKRARRSHNPAFRAKVALAAIKGERTQAGLAQVHDVHPKQVTAWKAHLLDGAQHQPDAVYGCGMISEPATV